MRNVFADQLTALAGDDERIVLLSGDSGDKLFDRFKERFPKRFYNCGVKRLHRWSDLPDVLGLRARACA